MLFTVRTLTTYLRLMVSSQRRPALFARHKPGALAPTFGYPVIRFALTIPETGFNTMFQCSPFKGSLQIPSTLHKKTLDIGLESGLWTLECGLSLWRMSAPRPRRARAAVARTQVQKLSKSMVCIILSIQVLVLELGLAQFRYHCIRWH